MTCISITRRGALGMAAAALAAPAVRAEAAPLRIGVIGEFSGVFADYGQQSKRAIALYQKLHGDSVAGRKVEIVFRDTGGANPEVARRAAQELVTQSKVAFLAGFGLTPNALAAAPIATESKTPMVVMNAAATSIVPTKSPYIVRISLTQSETAIPLATWAAKNGIGSVFTIVADYAPGIDSEKYFTGALTANGGKIAGSVRAPMANPEYAPYIQRAADAKPDAILLISPSGDQGLQFLKAFHERGLQKQIKVLSTGELTDEIILDALGDEAIGLITAMHYSMAHPSPVNKDYVAAWQKEYGPKSRTNWYSTGSWDGMGAMYAAIAAQQGDVNGDKALDFLKGYKVESPRGPISIDANRDIVQNIYIRRVERVGDMLQNVEFQTFEGVSNKL